jgi:cell division protein FtsW
MRIARRSADPFLRLLTATTTMWIIGQSFINVGYVIGLLPVTGIQLPLISAGGTSTATTLLMIGMMANAARHEPEAVAALRAGRDDRMTRILRLPLPEPYAPTRVEALRDRLRSKAPPGKSPRGGKRKPAGGRSAAQAPDRRTARSAGNGRAGGRHHGGEQRHTGHRRAGAGKDRAGDRVLEGQRYG